ncbi:MAG: oxygen-dependent coproporphyrinogen oxidase [Raineya sp.]
MNNLTPEYISEQLQNLQNNICSALEQADGKGKFAEDLWQRPGGGGGKTRILSNGNIIEKGGVNFSAVFGKVEEAMIRKLEMPEGDFFATGVSIVLHPHNPFVPIIHMNIRYFELQGKQKTTYWFGGGIDLTPHYIDREDARFFHRSLKNTCDRFDANFYPDFKKWADDYFFIKHRKETRGIGGIFFDKLQENEKHSKQNLYDFWLAVGETFAPTYTKLMQKNASIPFTEQHKQWQKLRRGRYVEFNLVYDAGTKFGLETDGRIESILMSLPQEAMWLYNFQPETGSQEAQTLALLQKDIDWLQI